MGPSDIISYEHSTGITGHFNGEKFRRFTGNILRIFCYEIKSRGNFLSELSGLSVIDINHRFSYYQF